MLTRRSTIGVKTSKTTPSTRLCHRPPMQSSKLSSLQQTVALVFVSLGIVSHHSDSDVMDSRQLKRNLTDQCYFRAFMVAFICTKKRLCLDINVESTDGNYAPKHSISSWCFAIPFRPSKLSAEQDRDEKSPKKERRQGFSPCWLRNYK